MKDKSAMREELSTLWIVVMFTMVFADILSFITPGMMKQVVEGTTVIKITQPLLLIFAFLLEIPIVMIFLARFLRFKINKILNIVSAAVTIPFVIFGGSLYLHYFFFATIEVACMLWIIILAIRWKEDVREE